MARIRRKRPNWPYRFAWLALGLSLALYVGVQTLIGAMTFGRRSYGIDWGLAFVASCLDATIAVWFVTVGAAIGSFLNVVAYRLPLGRSIGGHSSCPYCRTPIDGTDNVPVLAWIKLRGRCRACRLPISIQYPLVELSVAIVFFIVYVTEFASSGDNLPRELATGSGHGILRTVVSSEICMRLFAYLFALSSLIAAALMAVKRRRVPLSLYVWAVLPLATLAMVDPDILVVSWRSTQPIGGPVEARLDAIATMICGAVAAIAVARLLAPLVYRGFDRSFMGSDAQSRGARQFIGAMGVAGTIVGWQAVVPLSWMIMVGALVAVTLLRVCLRDAVRNPRFRRSVEFSDLTLWVWLGLLLFRSLWAQLSELYIIPPIIPEVVRQLAGALLLAPVVAVYGRLANPPIITQATQAEIRDNPSLDDESENSDRAQLEQATDSLIGKKPGFLENAQGFTPPPSSNS